MKTEMVNSMNSAVIGGNLVQLDNKNRYHITDKNGRKKVLTQDQYTKNIEANIEKIKDGEEFTFKKTKSPLQKALIALTTIAGATALFVYRKDIKNFFKTSKVNQAIEDFKKSDNGQKINETITSAKEKVNDVIKNPKKYATKADELMAKATEKTLNGFAKLVNFVSNIGKK